MWDIKIVRIKLNHELSRYLESHEYPSRLKPEEEKLSQNWRRSRLHDIFSAL
ncbi:hypothetical protein OROMI_029664 [Orobanche minor]